MASEALMRFMEILKILDNEKPNPEKRNLYEGLLHLTAMMETLLSKVECLENDMKALRKQFP